MNRTFGAFGILLGLLVLATIGVSSSSRSTQVRVISTKTVEKQTRRCGGGTFVIVLPETAPSGEPQTIATVQIELAGESTGLECPLDEVNCPSQGDAAYDYAVYGDVGRAATSNAGQAPEMEQHGVLNADELVGIFHMLERSSRQNCCITSSLRGWFISSSEPYLLGFKNWVVRKLESLPLSWIVTSVTNRQLLTVPAINWADYSILADRVVCVPPSPQPARVVRVADEHVQSGHWLLHSAASSLNHLALVLQATADRLQQADELAHAN